MKGVMKVATAGEASKEQLAFLEQHINELEGEEEKSQTKHPLNDEMEPSRSNLGTQQMARSALSY
jgi:hypothetical protein